MSFCKSGCFKSDFYGYPGRRGKRVALHMFKRQLKQAKGKTFALQVFIGFVTFAIQGYNLINEFLRGGHGGQGL